MSKNQWTVIGLLLFLLGLETLRSPVVKSFFTTIYSNFNSNLSTVSASAATSYSGLSVTVPAQNNVTITPTAPSVYPASAVPKARVS